MEELGAVTIAFALEQWVAIRCANPKMKREDSHKPCETVKRKILAWASYVDPHPEIKETPRQAVKRLRKTKEIIYVSQITPADPDQWRLCWTKEAYRAEDRLANTKAGRLMEKIKSFTRYCLQMNWVERDPAAFMEPIKPDETGTLPLLHGRFEAVIEATYLAAQQEAVRSYLDGGRWKMVDAVTEIETGKRNDRPALARALSLCRLHRATLVIAKLDRLARNVHFISGLMESAVDFIAVDFPKANRLTVHILASVAEHEALLISTRTKEALAAARARGVKLGTRNPQAIAKYCRKGTQASALARSKLARIRAADVLPTIHAIQVSSPSLSGIAAKLNQQGIPAPRGTWSAVQVSRALAWAI